MDRDRTQRARGLAWMAWGLLACSSGCVDPSYVDRPDGGLAGRRSDGASRHVADTLSDGAMSDGDPGRAVQPDAELGDAALGDAALPEGVDAGPPAWGTGMLGQYAVRARFFGRGLGLGAALNPLTNEWIWLSRVSFDPARGQLRMSSRICATRGINTFGGFAATVDVLYPQVLAPHEFQILSDGQEWWTDGDPALYGFSSASLVQCSTPGAEVNCAPEQESWMPNRKCVCPSATDGWPTSQFDCRINDADRDNQPGFTMRAIGDVSHNYHGRAVDDSDFVHGTMDARTGALSSASYAPRNDLLQLDCNPEPCAPSNSTGCDPILNPVILKRLAGPDEATVFSCEDVLQQQFSLFPADALVFPKTGC